MDTTERFYCMTMPDHAKSVKTYIRRFNGEGSWLERKNRKMGRFTKGLKRLLVFSTKNSNSAIKMGESGL